MARACYARLREVPLLAACWQRHPTLTWPRTPSTSGGRQPGLRVSSSASSRLGATVR
jgi:hypothetical protein